MNVYDSLYDSVDEDTQKTIKFLFKDESIKVKVYNQSAKTKWR